MNRVFLYITWAFGLILCFIPYIITSQLYPLKGPEWVETWQVDYTKKRIAYSSGFLVSLVLCAIYVYKTLSTVNKIIFDLLKLKEIIIVFIVIFMASGMFQAIRYSSPLHYFGTATVAALYALGFAGLMTMYHSAKVKDKNKRWLMLLAGAMCIFLSYLILDILNQGYVKH